MLENELKSKVIEEYKITRSGGTIAKKYGITNYKVYKWLREAGFEIKNRGPEKHPAQTMINLYESGMSTTKIAEKLDMNAVSVWERLKKSGISLRDRVTSNELNGKIKIKRTDYDEVIRLYQEGKSSFEIGLIFHVGKDAILDILDKHGIEKRNSRGANNHRWKGGITPLHTIIRNSAIYKTFRKEIMRERDYTCEITRQKGNKLNIHHVKPFNQLIAEFIKIYGSDSQDREAVYANMKNFAPFWDKNNILLITEDLHYKIHTKYGKEDEITKDMILALPV